MKLPRPLVLAVISGGVFIFGVLFGFVIFPVVLKSQLKKEMALSKKTDLREMWTRVPFALDFKIYFFNYTNPEEVQQGGVPVVEEVGPYYFEEWKEKVEMEDHEDDDTITYKKLDTFYFKKELSGPGLTGEELIVIPHIFILGVTKIIYLERPSVLATLEKGWNSLFDNPTDVFLRTTPLDILFRGVTFDCGKNEFAAKAVCTSLRREDPPGLVFDVNDIASFSVFGMRNATPDPHVVTVVRGMRNVMDVGKVVAIDGKPRQEKWRDQCNEYDGTDGTVFPPFLTKNDRIQSFSSDLCRSFKPWFQEKTSYSGIKTNRYVANIGDLAKDPGLQCFCDTPELCPKKGLMPLANCIRVPMYASLPHFLDSDPSLFEDVKGLKPDAKKHGIMIDFEPITGTPMEARQRVQFNIELTKIDKMKLCKELSNKIVPVLWLEEGFALNKTFVRMMNKQLFWPKMAVRVLSVLMALAGFGGVVAGAALHVRGEMLKVMRSSPKVGEKDPEDDSGRGVSTIESTQVTKVAD